MREFLLATLIAITVENILFTRALGSSRLLFMSKRSAKNTAVFGLALVLFTLAVTAVSFFTDPAVAKIGTLPLYIARPISYIIITVLLFALVCLVFSAVSKENFKKFESSMISACTTCAMFGTVLLSISKYTSFGGRMGYAAGSCLGFLLALLLTEEGKRRIRLGNTPKAFRGLPVTLIYIGLVSLAVYGLAGHQLPT